MIYYEGDYPLDDKRKTKNDKKAKREFNRYKRGGHSRSQLDQKPKDL